MKEPELVSKNARVLHVSGDEVWACKRNRLFVSQDGGLSWLPHAKLPLTCLREWLTLLPYGARLGRVGFHNFVKTSEDSAVIIAHGSIFRLNINEATLQHVACLHGSRPLSLCRSHNHLYYGEYRSNPERSPVHVWSGSLDGNNWQPAWQFDDVRHVHGVFHDPYTSAIWVTTGDEDTESAIWVTEDEFVSLRKVVGGSQMQRTIKLLFTNSHIYFGSDAPEMKNYLWRLSRTDANLERLCAVGGSVFSGTVLDGNLFFATAVEPSPVNKSRDVELWASSDGTSWRMIRKHKKDILPMKYFQYGQILFPAGPGDGSNLWYTPMSAQGDGSTFRIPLRHISGDQI